MATRPSVWTFKSIPAGGPIGRPAYGDEWILRGLRKHEANYSSVICFETGDPKRLLQLKEFFCGSKAKEKGYGEHSVYVYDPWNGLGELDKATKQVNPERPGEGRRLEEETGEQILVDTADAGFRMRFKKMVESRNRELTDITRSLEIDMIEISTAQDWIKPIMKFFNMRLRR